MADATPSSGALAVLAQARDLWAKQSRRRQTVAVGIMLAVIAGIGYATLFHHGEQWIPVSETASPADTSELYAQLQSHDITARLHDGKIEVPSERISEARAIATGAGLSNGITGLESFDTPQLGQSAIGEQVNIQRGLQGELERMISGIAQVETAKVMIAFGKTSVFKDQERPPSASVALHLHPGQTLTTPQVQGIRQLVAKGIAGLKPEDVVLVDQHGNLLVAGDASDADRKTAIERGITLNVRSILEKVVGEGNVSVVITADVDTSKTNETEETYDKDNPVIRSESRNVEGPNAVAGVGGISGTQGNLPGAPAAGPISGSGGAAGKLSETKNYEISRKVRQTEGALTALKKLHIAIVIDEKSVAGKPVARTEPELKQLTAIARTAAGFDEARGDTLELDSMAFAHADTTPPPVVAVDWTEQLPLPMPIMAIAAGAVVLLLLAVGFVLIVRRSRRRARREVAEAMPLALPAPLADLERMLDARPALGLAPAVPVENALPAGPPVQDRVLAAVRADVERAAAVLTSWLAEPPPKGAKP